MKKRLQPDRELDALVRRLNASGEEGAEAAEAVAPSPLSAAAETRPVWGLAPRADEGEAWLERLLCQARETRASDLLLVVGAPPSARVNGKLRPLAERPLSDAAAEMLCAALVPDARRAALEQSGSLDFTFRGSATGHCRCNVHRQRAHWSAAVRLFADGPPDLEQLNLPATLGRFAELEYGLVLVTGPTGSGKSTTLAALIHRTLQRRRIHLVTIEDPVEFEHEHTGSIVEHIEIGRDVPDFPGALRSVLRQDPDVILIGEMRDLASMSIAITAAETGHLVLSTLHTGDSAQTIHRILDSYPANQMETVRAQLSVSLAGIISQQLLPLIDGQGRVPAVEVLMATHAVRNLIRGGKIEQIRSQLTLERQSGMLDLDRSLAQLVRSGLVDAGEARNRARLPAEFGALLKGSR